MNNKNKISKSQGGDYKDSFKTRHSKPILKFSKNRNHRLNSKSPKVHYPGLNPEPSRKCHSGLDPESILAKSKKLLDLNNLKTILVSLTLLVLIIFLTPVITNFKTEQESNATLGPTISLSQDSSLPAGGDVITITGSGFEQKQDYFIQVSSGYDHNCAIASNNQAYCWGYGYSGGLGNGSTSNRLTPTLVTNPSNISSWQSISSGSRYTCAIANNSQAYCWGRGGSGQLGNGSTSNQLTPALVTNPSNISSWQSISSGRFHACAIANNNQTYCWGAGNLGRLGNGSTSNRLTPTLVTNPSNISSWQSISSGSSHTCAIANNNQAYCWGAGNEGQLGNDSTSNRLTPALVTNPSNVGSWQSISSGHWHTCAIADNSQAYCWGRGGSGQLGNGSTSNQSPITLVINPTEVNSWKSIMSGYNHTCAIADNNQAYCWGSGDHGRIGNGSFSDQLTPSLVTNPSNVSFWQSILIRASGTCGIANSDQAYCWGDGSYGQLGSGSTSSQSTPVLVDNSILGPFNPTIKFGNATVPAEDVEFVSANQIRVKVPAHAVGTVNITITNPNDPSDTRTYSNPFRYYSTASAPNNLTAQADSDLNPGQLRLSWNAPSNNGNANITDYRIQYRASGSSSWTTYNDGVSTNTSTIISGLSSNQEFEFRVAAINQAGIGAYSNTASSRLSYLTLSISNGNMTINLTPMPTDEQSVVNTVNVETNYVAGYTLRLDSGSNLNSSRRLIHSNDSSFYISPVSTLMNSPINLTNNSWGFRLPNNSSFGNNSNKRYLPIPTQNNSYVIRSRPTPTSGIESTNVEYGVRIDSTQTSGSYSQNVTYTLISN